MKCLNVFIVLALLLRSCSRHRHIFLKGVWKTKANVYLKAKNDKKKKKRFWFCCAERSRIVGDQAALRTPDAVFLKRSGQREEKEEKSGSRGQDSESSRDATLNTNGGQTVWRREREKRKMWTEKKRLRKEETGDLHEMWLGFCYTSIWSQIYLFFFPHTCNFWSKYFWPKKNAETHSLDHKSPSVRV